MHINKSFLLFLFAFGLSFFLQAQQEQLYLNKDKVLTYEKQLNGFDKASFHSAIKPYSAAEVYQFVYPDTAIQYTRLKKSDWFSKMINDIGYEDILAFDEHGFVKYWRPTEVEEGVTYDGVVTDTGYVNRKFYIAINPIVNIGFGYDFLGKNTIYTRTIGGEIKANIGKKVSLYTAFTNTVAKFPGYVHVYNLQTIAIPGEARSRPTTNGTLDFSSAIAYINYAPIKQLNFEIGQGKHFIGDGYRSLLLSDNAYNSPYAKLSTNFWRIKYTVIYAEHLNTIRRGTDFTLGYPKKLASYNYLSIDAAKWLQLGVFEGIMWKRTTADGNTFFDYNYLNPIIGVRAFQKKLDEHTNKIYGFNGKVTLPKYNVLYGQLAINSWGKSNSVDKRLGYQVGWKYFDVGNVANLNLQLEFNSVRPYMYQGKDSTLSYSHYNQSLAHPMGANFNEFLANISYQWKRVYAKYKMSFTKAGYDLVDNTPDDNNYGANILKSYTQASNPNDVSKFNGDRYSIFDNEVRVGYILNPKINLVVEAKLQLRSYKFNNPLFDSFKNNSFGFSLSTNIFNKYYDLPIIY
ncbi:MAG: hypothetical protein H6553_00820 [Chitinophagales bacterium]|nr:hypothetical protein [Chitinophagales bacterium]